MVVYADVLVLTNFYIDYLLLLATEKLCRVRVRFRRRLLGAAVSALFSLAVFLPVAAPVLSLAVKVVAACTTVLVAYGRARVWVFARRMLCFLAVTYGFAGVVLAVQLWLGPEGVLVVHGSVYWDVSPLLLLSATTACYLALWGYRRFFRRSASGEVALCLVVSHGGRKESLCALYDTGNRLFEPLSGDPVLVIDRDFATRLLGGEAADRLLRCEVDAAVCPGFRLVPYQAVGGRGVLPAFRPDRVTREGRPLPRLYLAVSPTPLREGYDGIAGPDALEVKEETTCC